MNISKCISYWIALMSAALLTGCTALQAPLVESPHLYLLDARTTINPAHRKSEKVLAISMPGAWPGFDTPQIAYLRQPFELEYFVTHRWADTPSHMLRPLLTQALEQRFRAIVTAPGMIPANIRLDTELIRLQQNFSVKPSRVEFTIRAQLTDVKDKRVIAMRLFDESENAASDDAYGGVIAANRALQRVLDQLADFCADTSASQ